MLLPRGLLTGFTWMAFKLERMIKETLWLSNNALCRAIKRCMSQDVQFPLSTTNCRTLCITNLGGSWEGIRRHWKGWIIKPVQNWQWKNNFFHQVISHNQVKKERILDSSPTSFFVFKPLQARAKGRTWFSMELYLFKRWVSPHFYWK